MKELFGGIDVGSEFHHVFVMDEGQVILYDRKVRHRFSCFHEALQELKEIESLQGGRISFAVEGKNGYGFPFDRILIENDFTLYNVDNLMLKRFRNIFGAEWKNDRRDAKMLARLMYMRKDMESGGDKAFMAIRKPPVVHEKIKILSRHQQCLINEKVRLVNQLNKKILEICPGCIDMVKDIDSKRFLSLLANYPDFTLYKKLSLKELLSINGIGKTTSKKFFNLIKGLECVEELADVYSVVIESYARRLLEVIEEIEVLDEKLEGLGQASEEAQLLRTIDGVGIKLSSRLIGEIGDINRFEDADSLAIYCGIGCIDEESGKSKKTRSVYKANKICKYVMTEIAGCTIRYVDESRLYYEKKRMEGKSHNHALRCLARQLIKVIYRMLTEGRGYYRRDDNQEYQKKAA